MDHDFSLSEIDVLAEQFHSDGVSREDAYNALVNRYDMPMYVWTVVEHVYGPEEEQ